MPKSSSSQALPQAVDAAASAVPAAEPTSFEGALAELEGLTARLESGQVPIDELLVGHQRAQGLLAFCRSRLQAVESALLVEQVGPQGEAQTRALDDAALRPVAGAVRQGMG